METNESNNMSTWKRPDEIIKLQRIKQRQRQLSARLIEKNKKIGEEVNDAEKSLLLKVKVAQKCKNPFAKTGNDAKRQKTTISQIESNEDSVLDVVNTPTATKKLPKDEIFVRETPTRPPPAKLVYKPFDAEAFSKLLHQTNSGNVVDDEAIVEEQKFTKHLPMDWSLKTRIRFFCTTDLPATTLKTTQMASGLTSFVRCIDARNSSSDTACTLDISPASRFNQATHYWQHPYIPWTPLFPRISRDTTAIPLGEKERKALTEDWNYSFRGLFQLLRAKQCPYFYVCANNFTVLFRAAGIGGCSETHAIMTPTLCGFRLKLKQEGVVYSMPLKKNSFLNKSESNEEGNSAVQQDDDEKVTTDDLNDEEENEDDDEVENEEWLESLGVDDNEIRKIQKAKEREAQSVEKSDDETESSLIFVEGAECQGFFSFLLNCKSAKSNVGRLAGVPPTLLAPVAFPKATMQHLTTRNTKVRMDGVDYSSIEVKGVILPTFLPYICQLLRETKNTFSATLASSNITLAFSKVSKKILEEHLNNEDINGKKTYEEVKDVEQFFGEGNLTDCGLTSAIIKDVCRRGQNAVELLERVCFDKDHGYAWS